MELFSQNLQLSLLLLCCCLYSCTGSLTTTDCTVNASKALELGNLTDSGFAIFSEGSGLAITRETSQLNIILLQGNNFNTVPIDSKWAEQTWKLERVNSTESTQYFRIRSVKFGFCLSCTNPQEWEQCDQNSNFTIHWTANDVTGQIVTRTTGECLTRNLDDSLIITACDDTNSKQKWRFQYNGQNFELFSSICGFSPLMTNFDEIRTTKKPSEYQLSGTIPASICDITDLTTIDFVYNYGLSGGIPDCIGRLKKLKQLRTFENYLSGTFPASITNCTELEDLRFGIKGKGSGSTIPFDFGRLTKLNTLVLRMTDDTPATFRYSGKIPESLGECTNLNYIDMSREGLTGTIPSALGRLTLLEIFQISQNKLTGPIPQELTLLTNLKRQNDQLENTIFTGNNFTLHCDCDFFDWYPRFVSERTFGGEGIAPCSDINGYSQTSPSLYENIPIGYACGYADFPKVNDEDLRSESITVNFTFPDENYTKDNTYPEFDLVLTDFPAAREDINGTFYKSFQDCNVIKPVDSEDRDKLLSIMSNNAYRLYEETLIKTFKVTLRLNQKVFFTKCYFMDELKTGENRFSFDTPDVLKPATEYDVVISPVNYVFSGQRHGSVDFIYWKVRSIPGVNSRTLRVTTKSDLPNTSPPGFIIVRATSDSVTLKWLALNAEDRNGQILFYGLQYYECEESICDGAENYGSTTQVNGQEKTVVDLKSNTLYRFRVRAATEAGYSEVYSILDARTCPENMKWNVEANSCSPVVGYFEIDGEAGNCQLLVDSNALIPDACLVEGLTVESLPIRKGYFRPNLESFRGIRPCPEPTYCEQTQSSTSTNARLLESGNISQSTDVYCTNNHRGTFCADCVEGFAMIYGNCQECDSSTTQDHIGNLISLIVVVVICGLLACAFVAYKLSPSAEIMNCPGVNQTFNNVWLLASVKIRILESFFQVLFGLQAILYLGFQNGIFVGIVNAMTTFDMGIVNDMLPIGCVTTVNHYSQLLGYTLGPLLFYMLVLLFGLAYVSFKSLPKSDLKLSMFSIFFIITFIIYPSSARIIMETFVCDEFETVSKDENGIFQKPLLADYTISCALSPERIGFLFYASIMVLVYPIGIIAVYSYFLRRYNKSEGEEQKRYASLVYDLIYPYKRNRFWFEAYDLLRKLVQTSVVAFCLPLGVEQASVVAQNISVIFFVALAVIQPYENPTDFALAIISMYMLTYFTQLNLLSSQRGDTIEESAEFKASSITAIVVAELLLAFILVVADALFFRKKSKHSKVDETAALSILKELDTESSL